MDFTLEETLLLPHLGDREKGYYKTEDGERVTLWWWDGVSFDKWGDEIYDAICSFYVEED